MRVDRHCSYSRIEVATTTILLFVLVVPCLEAAKLPGAFDLRNIDGKNFLSPIKNQLSSDWCSAFATIAIAEATVRMARPDLTSVDFSEAGLFVCDAGNTDPTQDGDSPKKVMKLVAKHGVYSERDFVYSPPLATTATQIKERNEQQCSVLSKSKSRAPYSFRYKDMIITIRRQAKNWIMTKGPLMAGIPTTPEFENRTSKVPGVYRHKRKLFNPQIDHAIALVGWNETLKAYLAQNSWGPDWNGDGFVWIGYDTVTIIGGLALK